jgi:hypothetical protein
VDLYKYFKYSADTTPCPNPNFRPRALESMQNPKLNNNLVDQYIEKLNVPKEVWENVDVAKEEIVQQTIELQLNAYNWWK